MMKTENIGERSITVTFDDPFPTTTHIIIGEKRVYICDTFIGPDPMEEISGLLKEEGLDSKQAVVFNSHADWDHVWGNCFFEDEIIVAHNMCRERMNLEWQDTLEKNKDSQQGEVVFTPPNLLFNDRIMFPEDGVEFFYTPGHTRDSASCYDHKDKVLFVGDNVESPIPYVNSLKIGTYIATLETYLEMEWGTLVAGHDPVQTDEKLVEANIEYLKQLGEWRVDIESLPESGQGVHLYTLMKLAEEVVTSGMNEVAREHYVEAIRLVEALEQTDRTEEYLLQMRRVVR